MSISIWQLQINENVQIIIIFDHPLSQNTVVFQIVQRLNLLLSHSFFPHHVTLRRHFKRGLPRIGLLTCSSNFRVTGNDMRDLRLASPGGHSTQRLMSPIGHLRVTSLNDHRVSSPSDGEIRVHSPSKFSFVSIIYRSAWYSASGGVSFHFSMGRRPGEGDYSPTTTPENPALWKNSNFCLELEVS